jgi:Flp pilus assembly pilin Flp
MSESWAHFFRQFRKEERGQDLADYCLLVALIALLGLGILYRVSGGMHDLWTVANSSLSSGNSAVSSSTAGASGASADGP